MLSMECTTAACCICAVANSAYQVPHRVHLMVCTVVVVRHVVRVCVHTEIATMIHQKTNNIIHMYHRGAQVSVIHVSIISHHHSNSAFTHIFSLYECFF